MKEQLEEKLDELFPKGKCDERGPALVLFSYAILLHEAQLQAQRESLIEIVKKYKCGKHKKLLASLTKEGGSLENKQ